MCHYVPRIYKIIHTVFMKYTIVTHLLSLIAGYRHDHFTYALKKSIYVNIILVKTFLLYRRIEVMIKKILK